MANSAMTGALLRGLSSAPDRVPVQLMLVRVLRTESLP
ncbi:hypothetical protein ANO14919_057890 [Xylariales sp. No.14919]|nr:hypothetical protein ANO14919_057890 [Xylariales sp. No.14919]